MNLWQLVQCLVSRVLNYSLPVFINWAFWWFIHHRPSSLSAQSIIFNYLNFDSALILINKHFSYPFMIEITLKGLRFDLDNRTYMMKLPILVLWTYTMMMSKSNWPTLNGIWSFAYLPNSFNSYWVAMISILMSGRSYWIRLMLLRLNFWKISKHTLNLGMFNFTKRGWLIFWDLLFKIYIVAISHAHWFLDTHFIISC